MFTKFIDKSGIKFDVVTQQYEVGTHVITNSDSTSQFWSKLKEDKYHITLRIEIIRDGGKLIEGTVIPYGGKYDINRFEEENDETKVKNN